MKYTRENLADIKGRAPLPSSGTARAVCEVIDSLGGGDIKQVRKYLPAALPTGKKMPTNAQLKTALSNSVYRGHLIRDGKLYRSARMEYYLVRRAHRKTQDAPHSRKKRKTMAPTKTRKTMATQKSLGWPEPAHIIEHVETRPIWHWWVAASLSLSSFGVGLVTGYLMG